MLACLFIDVCIFNARTIQALGPQIRASVVSPAIIGNAGLNRIGPVWILVLVVCLAGCGKDDGRIEVQGTATWNGEAIGSGYVELQPEGGKGQIVGADIVDGKFSVLVLPGTGRVSVVAHRQTGMTEPTERVPNPEPILFQFLPAQFNSNSELDYTVEANDPTLTLELEGNELSPRDGPTAEEKRRRAKQGGSG